jgi:N-acetylneuraminate synthase
MGKKVRIGNAMVGELEPCFVIAEIGINHNGDLALAKQLIDASKEAGADLVKFQKRTVDVVYSPEELSRPRESPFGTTNGDLKRGLEFGRDAYTELDRYCKERDILWCTSCWDEGAVDFVEQFNPPCYKIASACLTDDGLLRHHHKTGRPIILSTGMSTMEQIRHAVRVLDTEDLVILHCTSTYPSKPEELNLSAIRTLVKEFPNHPIGYSGHEVGLQTTVAAVAVGACVVERHITMDRAMWGSDQSASVEPQGFHRMVRDIRAVEAAMGDGVKRVYEGERSIIAKLRRVGK